MAGLDQDWYGMNVLRSYPIDDAATCIDDDGGRLPAGVLVDCSLRFPGELGVAAFLSGATITDSLATLSFEVSKNLARPSSLAGGAVAESFTPLGSVSVPLPAELGRMVPIEPAVEGAGGWVVLGPGVMQPYRGKFSTVGQSGLLARCARGSRTPPFRKIATVGSTVELDGVVTLAGEGDLSIRAGRAVLPGDDEDDPTPVLLAGLKQSQSRNVFQQYAGPCAGRPESGTCDPPAIEAINGVAPDGDGNLEIVFSSADVASYPVSGGGGIILDVPRTLGEMCPPGHDDGADPGTGVPYPPGYDDCGDHTYFGASDPGLSVVAGTFMASSAGYQAQSGAGPSATVKSRALQPRLITARFILPDAIGVGGRDNGGVVFGCKQGPPTIYYLAIGDIQAGAIEIYKASGIDFDLVASQEIPRSAPIGDPPRVAGGAAELRVEIGDPGPDGNSRVAVSFVSMSASGRLVAHLPGVDGDFGVGSYQCYPVFTDLHAEDAASAN